MGCIRNLLWLFQRSYSIYSWMAVCGPSGQAPLSFTKEVLTSSGTQYAGQLAATHRCTADKGLQHSGPPLQRRMLTPFTKDTIAKGTSGNRLESAPRVPGTPIQGPGPLKFIRFRVPDPLDLSYFQPVLVSPGTVGVLKVRALI